MSINKSALRWNCRQRIKYTINICKYLKENSKNIWIIGTNVKKRKQFEWSKDVNVGDEIRLQKRDRNTKKN